MFNDNIVYSIVSFTRENIWCRKHP